jgi:squalene cyclase
MLDDTTGWLLAPANWEHNQGTPGFNNVRLAKIQFAAALAEAVTDGLAAGRGKLVEAARMLVAEQDADGSWKVDTGGAPGAPATYGTTLATYMARRSLEVVGGFGESVSRANRWLERSMPGNVLEAAAMLLAMPKSGTVRGKCLDLVLRAQSSDGGWGPQAHAPAEPFDTAIVLLALEAMGDRKQTGKAIERGRAFLVSGQQADGSWMETTRPAGQLSYAEHISTTGWALYALLRVK